MDDPYGCCGMPKDADRALQALDAEAKPVLTLRTLSPQDMELFARWLSAPHVARWYHEPEDWLREAADRDGAYRWIRHFIAELAGRPVGFCQYYEYRLGGEAWHGSADVAGAYSIDYLIGESAYLGTGLGRQMVETLVKRIGNLRGAKRIIVQPEPENLASCGVLRACGFRFDEENKVYLYDFNRSAETL